MAEGTTAIDLALETEGDADGTDLIEFGVGAGDFAPTGQLQYIRDHEERAARKLVPAYWGKPFVAALLSAFMRELQAVEDTLWDIMERHTLEAADLPRLKVLGRIVGQPRLGFSEGAYRTLIAARALANVSRGRASDMLAVLELLVGPGDYNLLEIGGATLWLTVETSVDDEGFRMLEQVLPDTRAAGVGLQLLFSDAPFEDLFVWGDAWGDAETWGSARIL